MDEDKVQKNTSPSERLISLFENGINTIPVKKSDDIFKQLETRSLSREERDIINKRVAHQQKLFEEYEKREQTRKIAELQNVCEGLSNEEALLALQKCNDSEDEAALLLTSDTSFLQTIRESLKSLRKYEAASKLNEINDAAELEYNETSESLIPELKWGKKATRSTVNRIPINTHQLESIKTTFGDMPTQSASSRSRSRRSSRLQGRFSELLQSRLTDDDEDRVSSGEEYHIKSPRPVSGSIALGDRAISKSGYTCRGRVKQKAQKRVEVLAVGELNAMKGWYNAGYIFPLGFKSRTSFRSSVVLNAMCVHDCEIIKGKFWPMPTFMVTASDRPHEPLISKSCTGSWSLVLRRINNEIERRRKEGENIPPPPKTAIAGPEYFGLVQEDSVEKIEALDQEKKCALYWAGKREREIALQNLPSSKQVSKTVPEYKKNRGRSGKAEKWAFAETDDDDDDDEEEEDIEEIEEAEGEEGDNSDTECRINRWSSINRSERYKRRCLKKGVLPEDPKTDSSNPLPTLIDPVTLETVVAPAISPYGHVMGIATWRAYLMNNNVCPFTKKPLKIEQCALITKHNIHKYKDSIKHV